MSLESIYEQIPPKLQTYTSDLDQALHTALSASSFPYASLDKSTQQTLLQQITEAIYQSFNQPYEAFPLANITLTPLIPDIEISSQISFLRLVRQTTNAVFRETFANDTLANYAIERFTEAIMQAKQELHSQQFTKDLHNQQHDARVLLALAENAIDGIVIASLDAVITYANPAYCRMIGLSEPPIGRRASEFDNSDPQVISSSLFSNGSWTGQIELYPSQGGVTPAHLSVFYIPDEHGNSVSVAAILRDRTEEARQEEERIELQRRIIDTQQALLYELSTPIIPISDETLVMPIIGSIDTLRAQQLFEHALQGINDHRANYLILDITGVRIVDTHVANVLVQTSVAAQLLGAHCILTGIRPEVAQTLVSLNLDLGTIETYANLQIAIARTLAKKA